MPAIRERPPLLVRADADAVQGTGHVMRCLALAHAWRMRGGAVTFISHQLPETLKPRLYAAGAELITIGDVHPAFDDICETIAAVENTKLADNLAPWVVLDGYQFDTDYQRTLARAGCRLLVVDDNAHCQCYAADIVLNHGVHAPRLEYAVEGNPWLLLGTRYALLRPEFARWHAFVRETAPKAHRVLVCLGGGDTYEPTVAVLEALAVADTKNLEVRVLAGALLPRLESLRRRLATSGHIAFESNVADPTAAMAWADLAVAAGGTTAWELARMQVPMILLTLAHNQVAAAAGLAGFGAARSLGWFDRVNSDDLQRSLCELLADAALRRRMSERGRVLVDGLGAARVVSAMDERSKWPGSDQVSIRPARRDDMLLIWQWANDPAARQASFNPTAISWDDHERWWRAKIGSSDCRMWLLQLGDLPVGHIRYDRVAADSAEISFIIARGFRGLHLGTRMLEMTTEYARRELAVRTIRGIVKNDNPASLRAFENARFEVADRWELHGRECVVFQQQPSGVVE